MSVEPPLYALMVKYRAYGDYEELDPNDVNWRCVDDDTLLHLVTRYGTTEEIELLVASGAQINAVGDIGYTPLHTAAGLGRLDIVERLVALGADVSIRCEIGHTPADIAGYMKYPEIADVLNRAKPTGS